MYELEALPIPSSVPNKLPFNGSTIRALENSKELEIWVYQLYNLSYNEILVIDPETTISHEEYENFIKTKG